MIKKLQRKFVLITAVCLLAVELLIVGLINVVNMYQVNHENNNLLNIIIENDGKFPAFKPKDGNPPGSTSADPFSISDNNHYPNENKWKEHGINEETRFQTRYFVVFLDKDGEAEKVDTGHVSAVSSSEAVEYARKAIDDEKETGYSGYYKYKLADNENGKIAVFMDCRNSMRGKTRFLVISIIIAGAGYLVVCLMVIIFSKRAIRPVLKSMEKQRQFITDAGHEIKTPLAIISANTEVLEMTGESNEWTQSIKNQISRLNSLLQNLLNLAKMEEETVSMNLCTINISEAAEEAVKPFETLAHTNGKSISADINSGLIVHGDKGAIKQLVSIFIENAVKYSDDGGEIKVKLYPNPNGKGARLTVANPCKNPPKGDLSRLFDRFYRADSSRSRAGGECRGGYGIGLSIAQAIMEAHKGKVYCKAENGEIEFCAVFKN